MAGKATKTTKPDIKLNSYESLFGDRPDYGDATELPIKELHDYKQHPFRVIDDEDMLELVQSIKDKGILVPLTVRPVPEGDYDSSPAIGESMRLKLPVSQRSPLSLGICPMKMRWIS